MAAICEFLNEFESDEEDEAGKDARAAAAAARAAAAAAPPAPVPQTPPFRLTTGAPFEQTFIAAAGGAFTPQFGAENFAPLLYSLVRFMKPRRLLEVSTPRETTAAC